MYTDIRFPMGFLFAIIGALLTVYGLTTGGAAMYSRSLGININLYSGVCLFVFGMLMLVMAMAKAKREKNGAQ